MNQLSETDLMIDLYKRIKEESNQEQQWLQERDKYLLQEYLKDQEEYDKEILRRYEEYMRECNTNCN